MHLKQATVSKGFTDLRLKQATDLKTMAYLDNEKDFETNRFQKLPRYIGRAGDF